MRILLIEDDVATAQFVERALGELGHNVLLAADGDDGLHFGLTEAVDVIVVDRLLPEVDGVSLVRRLRSGGVEVPVLMLTALGRIEDRVDGLDAGADDYLTKPFAISELVARINALARRMAPQAATTRLVAGGLSVDLLSRSVIRDGRSIALQPREFRILEELMRHPGEYITRTMLLERVWNYHFDPQTKIIETHISRLRSKLNEGGLPDPIETERGVGYRIVAL